MKKTWDQTLTAAFDLLSTSDLSMARIAKNLNDQGYRSKRGKPLTDQTIKAIKQTFPKAKAAPKVIVRKKQAGEDLTSAPSTQSSASGSDAELHSALSFLVMTAIQMNLSAQTTLDVCRRLSFPCP